MCNVNHMCMSHVKVTCAFTINLYLRHEDKYLVAKSTTEQTLADGELLMPDTQYCDSWPEPRMRKNCELKCACANL